MGNNEMLAVAITAQSLQWSAHQTRPIEFVAALSGASPLASDIFRARHHDSLALRRAILVLAQKAQKIGKQRRLHLSLAQAITFSAAVLVELLSPECRLCLGASVVANNSLRITCPNCDGTGVHRFSDRERSQNCNISDDAWHRWQRRYEMVLALARASDNAVSKAAARLG